MTLASSLSLFKEWSTVEILGRFTNRDRRRCLLHRTPGIQLYMLSFWTDFCVFIETLHSYSITSSICQIGRSSKAYNVSAALIEWCLYKKDKQANTTVYMNVKGIYRVSGGSSISAEDNQNYDIRSFPTLVQATTLALPSMTWLVSFQTGISFTIPLVCKLSAHWVYL